MMSSQEWIHVSLCCKLGLGVPEKNLGIKRKPRRWKQSALMAVLLLRALIEASISCLLQLGELLKNTILFLRSSAKLAGQYWSHVTLKDSTRLQMLTDSSKMISFLHMELWLPILSTVFSYSFFENSLG